MHKLTLKQAVIDIFLIAILTFIHFYGYFILIISSFGFFTCGNAHLEEYNNIRTGFIIAIVILVIEAFASYKLYRLGTVIWGIGCWILTASILIPIVQLGIPTFQRSEYYKEFDSKEWKSNDQKPFSMIRTFYEDNRFIGLTKNEVVKQLGPGKKHYSIDSTMLYYETEAYYSSLIFEFKNGKVETYYLSCND